MLGGRSRRAPGRRTGGQGEAAQPGIAEVTERPGQPAARPGQCGSSIFRAPGRTGKGMFRSKSTPGGVAERPQAPALPRAGTRATRAECRAASGRPELPTRAGDGALFRRRPLPRPVPPHGWAPNIPTWAPNLKHWAPEHRAWIRKTVFDQCVALGRLTFRSGRPTARPGRPSTRSRRPLGAQQAPERRGWAPSAVCRTPDRQARSVCRATTGEACKSTAGARLPDAKTGMIDKATSIRPEPDASWCP